MSRLPVRDETYVTTVRGMCGICRRLVPARVTLRKDGAWQRALCPRCPAVEARIAASADTYLRHVLSFRLDEAPLPGSHPPRRGCPLDCGPCTWHSSSPKETTILLDSPSSLGALGDTPLARDLLERLRDCGCSPRAIRLRSRPSGPGSPCVEAESLRDVEPLARAGVRILLVMSARAGDAPETLGPWLDLLRGEKEVVGLEVRADPAGNWFQRDGGHSDFPVDALARWVADATGGTVAADAFRSLASAHPLCVLEAPWPGGSERSRTIRVHACMDAATFDASRALSCPFPLLVSPGRRIPACLQDLSLAGGST